MAVRRAKGLPARRRTIMRADLNGRVRPSRGGRSGGFSGRPFRFNWTKAVSQEQWEIYSKAIEAARSAGVRFMLGGGFALAAFTGRWRDTKDIDFYILPEDRDRVVAVLS